MSTPQAANNAYGYGEEPQPTKGKTEPGVKGVVSCLDETEANGMTVPVIGGSRHG